MAAPTIKKRGGGGEEHRKDGEDSSSDASSDPLIVEAESASCSPSSQASNNTTSSASSSPPRAAAGQQEESPSTKAAGSSKHFRSLLSEAAVVMPSVKGGLSILAQQLQCWEKNIQGNFLASAFTGRNMVILVDSCLQKWSRYVQSATGQDRVLKFLQWTLWLLSWHFSNSGKPRRRELSGALRKLYFDLSFARYATRLVGMLGAVEAARTGSWTYPSQKYPSTADWIGRALAWSMIGYYPTEHLAYVRWMVPSSSTKYRRSAERWSYISCRFWLLYLLAEMAQCAVRWKELRDEQRLAEGGGDGDDKNSKSENRLALRNVKYQMARDALFLLPCVHWSLPNWDVDPWLPESLVNFLMWLESVVSLYQ